MEKNFNVSLVKHEDLKIICELSDDAFKDDALLNGLIKIKHYSLPDYEDNLCKIYFFILNPYARDDLWFIADSISADLEYVVGHLIKRLTRENLTQPIVVIDTIDWLSSEFNFEEKLYLLEQILIRISNFFSVLGGGYVAFMSKALFYTITKPNFLLLINMLQKLLFIPISQTETDFIFIRSLEYRFDI